jgi:hypothetical protein
MESRLLLWINEFRHKGDTIATVMTNSLPNVTFRRDLIEPQLMTWNALLQRLAFVHLSPINFDGTYTQMESFP